jgi:outer membrane receptor protein involved in Fe transport
LYRGFRVGNVVTNANENLLAERATNFEAGGAFRRGFTGFRVTTFITDIDRTISNVTISATPSLITRQRQNAGKTRTSGVEVDAETRIARLELNAGYLFADSRVAAFPSNPVLVDKLIPQVPRHQFTFQTRLPYRTWVFAVQGRASSAQFDDDLNEFSLEPYFQLDGLVSKRLKEKLEIFAAVENLFNARYSVGRTPVRTVNGPINARLGIRWN